VKLLNIDFTEIQKAMEDVSRDAYDYFLDLETGGVITISVDMLEKAEKTLCSDDEKIITAGKEIDEYDMPEWIEKEVELSIKIFSDRERYVRIPERESYETYNLMREFVENIDEFQPHDRLYSAINGKGAFSRFKKVLVDYPVYREKWFAFNANTMKKEIAEWLKSIGIRPEQEYY
jgi:hypothetical protein